jgi:predicted metal-binding membrane protein
MARALLWPTFFGLVLASWAALWVMAGGGAAAFDLAALCSSSAGASALPQLWAMWAVMSAAMMAPTAVPALRTFEALPAPAGRPAETASLLAGYLAVWLGASLGFALVQLIFARFNWLHTDGQALGAPLTAALLATAGLYQFSRAKAACLSRCRLPLTLFLERWRPGTAAAFGLGLRLGVDCLGCCWALMLLAFVGGMENLLFMGLTTLVMVLEKLPEIGRPLTRPLGYALLGAAGAALIGGMT